MKWFAFAILVYAVVANNLGNKAEKTNNTEAEFTSANDVNSTEVGQIKEVIEDTRKTLNLDKLEGRLLPKATKKPTVEDTLSGQGAPAICGQEATVIYRKILDTSPTNESDTQTTSFTIGDGSAPPYIEDGIAGMAKGGKRIIHTPENERIELELANISPTLPDMSGYRILGDISEQGKIYKCGAVAKLNVTIWSVEGKKLFDSKENGGAPITFTIGKSEVFFGLEAGALGMGIPSQRSLIAPPATQKTLNGGKPAIDFPLPKYKTAIVDIESVP